jgi:membrane associated rhomboid family serine protease
MEGTPTSRLTRWVGRLLVLNAAGLLLLSTVLTAPRFFLALQFDPSAVAQRPWTLFTYMFVHGSLLHFALNGVLLFLFGPPVERKLGSRRFIAYYLYCGVGAALFALGLARVLEVAPFAGASGALLGVMLAFVVYWPDAELASLPLPLVLTARSVFGIIVAGDVVGALVAGTTGLSTGIAHLAHVGGIVTGYVFFRIQSLVAGRPAPRPASVVRRPVVTPMRVQETVAELQPAAPVIDRLPAPGDSDAEVDRVLDKISQFGIESLTTQERQFLADVAERKRKEGH